MKTYIENYRHFRQIVQLPDVQFVAFSPHLGQSAIGDLQITKEYNDYSR